MNVGRTIPHAVLTIFLLDSGTSLSQIAYLQIAYMITVFLFEIPSGYLSDHWSRKNIYVVSITFMLFAYVMIYIGHGHLYYLIVAWILYGFGVALSSGSMESEVINQIKQLDKDIRQFVIWNSYVSSSSAAIGALIGSFLYIHISRHMYAFSLICFIISLLIATLFQVKSSRMINKDRVNLTGLKNVVINLCKIRDTQEVIILFMLVGLFLQPFFQYWQVLFEQKGMSIHFFGVLYIMFQLCNIAGTYIYDRLKYKEKYTMYFLLCPWVQRY